MDFHNTGSGFLAAIQGYLAASRQTGRTKRLINYLTDDDRVVCTDSIIAGNLADRCADAGKHPKIVVIPVKDWAKLRELSRVNGRTILDHTWVEEFHLESLRMSVRELDAIEKRFSAVPKTEGKKMSQAEFEAGLEITADGIRSKATPSAATYTGQTVKFKLGPSFVKGAIAKGWAAGFTKPTASEAEAIPAIKIGQVWRTREGKEVLITKMCHFPHFPDFKWGSASCSYTDKGIVLADGKKSPFDLITLLEDVKPAMPALKIGQVWRCYDGELVTITGYDEKAYYPWLSTRDNYQYEGKIAHSVTPRDLCMLVKEAPKLAVGQIWLCRDGVAVTINSNDNHRVYPWNSGRDCYTDEGRAYKEYETPYDLVMLVSSTANVTRLAPGKAKFTVLAWKVKDDDGTVSEGRTHVAGDADKALKRWVDQFMTCGYELLSVHELTNETP